MPQSIRRPPLPGANPPAAPPPPDRYVKAIKVGGLFREYDVNIAFDRSKNFLIGPNGSGKTTIVHILASCLKNDFTQLFSLPFGSAEITLQRISTSNITEVIIRQKYVSETGRRSLEVTISGDDNEHSEEIELRSAQLSHNLLWDMGGERSVASTTAGLAELMASLTNTTWLSIHRGEIEKSRIGGESLVDRHHPTSYWDIIGRDNPHKGVPTVRRQPRRRTTATGMRADGSRPPKNSNPSPVSDLARQP